MMASGGWGQSGGVYEIDGEGTGLRSGQCGNKFIFPSRLTPHRDLVDAASTDHWTERFF